MWWRVLGVGSAATAFRVWRATHHGYNVGGACIIYATVLVSHRVCACVLVVVMRGAWVGCGGAPCFSATMSKVEEEPEVVTPTVERDTIKALIEETEALREGDLWCAAVLGPALTCRGGVTFTCAGTH